MLTFVCWGNPLNVAPPVSSRSFAPTVAQEDTVGPETQDFRQEFHHGGEDPLVLYPTSQFATPFVPGTLSSIGIPEGEVDRDAYSDAEGK